MPECPASSAFPRSSKLAAALKLADCAFEGLQEVDFRAPKIAAPLKQGFPCWEFLSPHHFRAQKIAASLKQATRSQRILMRFVFPRSESRGPIEATTPAADELTAHTIFRDQMIAAPFKLLRPLE